MYASLAYSCSGSDFRVPDNVNFEIDDVESEWLYQKNSFDLIHSRYMIGALGDWNDMIVKAYRLFTPRALSRDSTDPALGTANLEASWRYRS